MKWLRVRLIAITVGLFIPLLTSAQSHVAKIQIQGDDMKPMKSKTWDKGSICSKEEGVKMLNDLWNSLSSSQKKEREEAYREARDYISNAPANGYLGGSSWSKTFQSRSRKIKNARIDIEIYRGSAFANDRHIVYLKVMGSDLSRSMIDSWDERKIMSKDEAKKRLKELWDDLSTDQKKVREDAYREALRYIEGAPDNGYVGGGMTKEFKDSSAKKGEKIVIVIDKGAAFSD